ncbi:hypothetical protein ASE89_07940 [Sphingomonas sp. Leaf30]|nr:hypothetical protein ASE89_07940 [Sphingomonas sp. Leaf30]
MRAEYARRCQAVVRAQLATRGFEMTVDRMKGQPCGTRNVLGPHRLQHQAQTFLLTGREFFD